MKNPLQMYSKIGDLKIIQIKREKNNNPHPITGNPSALNSTAKPLNSAATPSNLNKTKGSFNRIEEQKTTMTKNRNQSFSSINLPPHLPLLAGKKSIPLHPFIGSLNKKLTTGIIISSKINQLRKDGMSFKYFRYNYLLSQDIGKLSKQPLTYEYKLSSSPLLAKKYIKIINGYSFYDLHILNLIG